MPNNKELKLALKSRLIRGLTKATLIVFEDAFIRCPVNKKGGHPELRSALRWEVDEKNLVGKVYVDTKLAPYAPYVEYNTKPHVIKPKGGKKFLAWKDPGSVYAVKKGKYMGFVFSKIVYHPGTTAQPFLRPALWTNKTRILQAFAGELTI